MSQLRTFLSTWFDNFRYQTFFLTVLSACSLAKEVADYANVPSDKKPFVVGLFGVAIGFSFVLNPKSVTWVQDAKSAVDAARKGDYDAVADLIDDPLDESRDKDPQLELPIYRNSADETEGQ